MSVFSNELPLVCKNKIATVLDWVWPSGKPGEGDIFAGVTYQLDVRGHGFKAGGAVSLVIVRYRDGANFHCPATSVPNDAQFFCSWAAPAETSLTDYRCTARVIGNSPQDSVNGDEMSVVPAVAPTIVTSVNPTSMSQYDTATEIVITGSGFASGGAMKILDRHPQTGNYEQNMVSQRIISNTQVGCKLPFGWAGDLTLFVEVVGNNPVRSTGSVAVDTHT